MGIRLILILITISIYHLGFAQGGIQGFIKNHLTNDPAEGVEVFVNGHTYTSKTNKKGYFKISPVKAGTYTVVLYQHGYSTITRSVVVSDKMVDLDSDIEPIEELLDEIEIAAKNENTFSLTRLRSVDGMGIYSGKKSEVIDLEMITANLATNNSRQIFNKVAGLNIWESDCAGLQLGVGGRGLSPNRTSNFNTRQNGYDMSADALGYPESYYSPPMQAIKKVEIVRGAASLQYGSQFGGMLNLVLKNGPEDKKIEVESEQTIGSFNLFNSFNSVGGKLGNFRYYFFSNYRKGDCWRCNSEFEVNSSYGVLKYAFSDKLSISLESTYMTYLARQAGGLTQALFEEDPQQSIRDRNWFKVNWSLSAFNLDYKFSDRTKLNWKTFGLRAQRNALGYLGKISRLDPMDERDLLVGDFNNLGSEMRLLHRYKFNDEFSTVVIGGRAYRGITHNRQGDASANSDADFNFLNPEYLEVFDYNFPSYNLSLFIENVFNITNLLSVTPGIRYEWISTNADGYYRNTRRDLAGNIYWDQQIFDSKSSDRGVLLYGIGANYKLAKDLDFYTNFSRNYKSINFNDFRISNINLVVDSNIQDESGYNFDFGWRGKIKNVVDFDVSGFYLKYNGRIGSTIKLNDMYQIYRFRTNISDSRNIGVESYVEADLIALFNEKAKKSLSIFSNVAVIDAKYINSDEAAINGNQVESVPFLNMKTGISYRTKHFKMVYQFTYMDEQFSDATNAVQTADAVAGIIPEYYVMDLSCKYSNKGYNIQLGMNNLMDAKYFTRRASGYPGPGIIPSEGRNVYITLGLKI